MARGRGPDPGRAGDHATAATGSQVAALVRELRVTMTEATSTARTDDGAMSAAARSTRRAEALKGPGRGCRYLWCVPMVGAGLGGLLGLGTRPARGPSIAALPTGWAERTGTSRPPGPGPIPGEQPLGVVIPVLRRGAARRVARNVGPGLKSTPADAESYCGGPPELPTGAEAPRVLNPRARRHPGRARYRLPS